MRTLRGLAASAAAHPVHLLRPERMRKARLALAALAAALVAVAANPFSTAIAAQPAATIIHFGDSTLAGAGGAAITGTSIASGDPRGYFALSNGRLTLTRAGGATTTGSVSNGNAMASCTAGQVCETIVTNLGQSVSIIKDAGTFDVATQADWNAVTTGAQSSAANLSGKHVELRPNITITCNINNATAGRRSLYEQNYWGSSGPGLVVEARDVTQPATCNETNGAYNVISISSSGLTLRGLVFSKSTQGIVYLDGTSAHPVNNVTLDHDTFQGLDKNPNGDYSGRFRNFQIGVGNGTQTTFTYTAVDNDGHGLPVAIDGSGPGGHCTPYCGRYGFTVTAGSVTGSDTPNPATTGGSGNISGTGIVPGSGASSNSCSGATGSYVCYDEYAPKPVGKMQIVFTTAPAAGTPILVSYNVDGGDMWQNDIGVKEAAGKYICDISVTNSKFLNLQGAVNLGACGTTIVSGNYIDTFYNIAIHLSYPSTGVPTVTNISDNFITRPVAINTDNGNPHEDIMQLTANYLNVTGNWPVVIDRNIAIRGNSRGTPLGIHLQGLAGGSQVNFSGALRGNTLTTTGSPPLKVGMILAGANVPNQTHITAVNGANSYMVSTTVGSTVGPKAMAAQPDSGYFYTGEAIGNILNVGGGAELAVEHAYNFKAWNNTVVGRNNSAAAGCSANCDGEASIIIGGSSDYNAPGRTAAGKIDVQRNVAHGVGYGITGQNTDVGNVSMVSSKGGWHMRYTYCQVFAGLGHGASDCTRPDGPTWDLTMTTAAAAMIRFAPLPGGPLTPAVTGQTYPTGALGTPAPIKFAPQPQSPGTNNVH